MYALGGLVQVHFQFADVPVLTILSDAGRMYVAVTTISRMLPSNFCTPILTARRFAAPSRAPIRRQAVGVEA